MRAVRAWIILAFLLGFSACGDDAPRGDDEARGALVAQDQVRSIRVLGVQTGLPPSARQVWLYENSWLDAIQMLRFDASLSDARTFARSVLGRETLAGEDPRLHNIGREYPWWIRGYPKGAEGGSRNENGLLIDVVLVPNGDQARVWILVSQS